MKRSGRGARYLVRLMDAAISTRNAILAPVALGVAVLAGVLTGDAQVFQGALAVGAVAWIVSVLNTASERPPYEKQHVIDDREHILAEINAGLDMAARQLIERAQRQARRGRAARPLDGAGYDQAAWESRRGQLARIYELAEAVERAYGNAEATDATALLALPEVPRQIEKAVRLARRRVTVLQSLYSTTEQEIVERLTAAETEVAEPGISEQLRRVRAGRADLVRRELETYHRLAEERETIDALLDSLESFLRRLSFRTISTEEVQSQIAAIDESLEAHDQAMAAIREELRRSGGGALS